MDTVDEETSETRDEEVSKKPLQRWANMKRRHVSKQTLYSGDQLTFARNKNGSQLT